MQTVLRHGATPFGHARAAMEVEATPWQCKCGAMLRKRATRFGVLDVVVMVGIAGAWVIGSAYVPWIHSFWILGIAEGLWASYRTAAQFSIEELPDAPPPRAIS